MPVVSWAIGTSIIFATGVTSAAAVTGILAATSAVLACAPNAETVPHSEESTMPEIMVSIVQHPSHDPSLRGLSFFETIDHLAQFNTVGTSQIWASIRAFEPAPPSPMPAVVDHRADITALGDCMPSGAKEGDTLTIDESLPIRPGDLAAVVYRGGVAPQAKTYLGRWVGGDHSLIAGNRKIDAVYCFAQENPPAFLILPEDDLVAAVRVSNVDPWTVDARQWPNAESLLKFVEAENLPGSTIQAYAESAERERQAFFQFLIARCNAEEQEAFYRRHPEMRVIA